MPHFSPRPAFLITLLSCTLAAPLAEASSDPAQSVAAILEKCRNASALIQNAQYTFENMTHTSGVPDNKSPKPQERPYPQVVTRRGSVRRDGKGRWYVDYTIDEQPPTPEQKAGKYHWILVLADKALDYKPTMFSARKGKGAPTGVIVVLPDDPLFPINALGDGTILEGLLLRDQSEGGRPTYIFDILKNATLSNAPGPGGTAQPTLTVTDDQYGTYQLTVDPAHSDLPTRLEITKTADNFYRGAKLRLTLGIQEHVLFPNRPFSKYHLLLDDVHLTAIDGNFLIDSAHLVEQEYFDDGTIIEFNRQLRRTDIHLDPKFSDDDFTLDAPDHTRVGISGDRSGPTYDWIGKKLVPHVDPATIQKLDQTVNDVKAGK